MLGQMAGTGRHCGGNTDGHHASLFQLVRINAPVNQYSQSLLLQQSVEQPIAGSIWDDAGEPLSGVEVSVVLAEKVMAQGTTDSLGRYVFRIAAPRDADITLLAQRTGYHTEKRYTHLGNPGFNFKMRRKRE